MSENTNADEKRDKKNSRERVIHQSNFFTLSDAVKKFNFPLTVQIIPSLQLKLFESDESNKYERQIVTVVGQVSRQKIQCLNHAGDAVELPVKSIAVHSISIDRNSEDVFYSIEEIIRARRKRKIEWIVVMKSFSHKELTFAVGEILQIKNPSKFSSLRGNKKLPVVICSTSTDVILPANIEGEFRTCFEPNFKRPTKLLSEIAKKKSCPYVIKFPSAVDKELSEHIQELKVVDINKAYVVATDTYEKHVYIACKKTKDMLQIHTIPSHIDADVEVLHGETPVECFTQHQINIIKSSMIYNDINYAEQNHQKRDFAELNLKEQNDEVDNEDEDIYSNFDDVESDAGQYENKEMWLQDNLNEKISDAFLSSTKKLGSNFSHDNQREEGDVKARKTVPEKIDVENESDKFKYEFMDTSRVNTNDEKVKVMADVVGKEETKIHDKTERPEIHVYLSFTDCEAENERTIVTTASTNLIIDDSRVPDRNRSSTSYTKRPPKKINEQKKDYIDDNGYMAIKLCSGFDEQATESSLNGSTETKKSNFGNCPSAPSACYEDIDRYIEMNLRDCLGEESSIPRPKASKTVNDSLSSKKDNQKTSLPPNILPRLPAKTNSCRSTEEEEVIPVENKMISGANNDSENEATKIFLASVLQHPRPAQVSSQINYDYPDMFEELSNLEDLNRGDTTRKRNSEQTLKQQTSLAKIATLTVNEISKLLKVVSLHDKIEHFKYQDIDGCLLVDLSEDDLLELKLTQFEARKLYQYVNGWRPLVDTADRKIKKLPSEFNVDEVSSLFSDMKMLALSNFVSVQSIDGQLMMALIQDDVLSTLGRDHGIYLKRIDLLKLKKTFLEGYEPKY